MPFSNFDLLGAFDPVDRSRAPQKYQLFFSVFASNQNGVRNLAHALERNSYLSELRLAVRIGEQADKLASALEQNEHLKVPLAI